MLDKIDFLTVVVARADVQAQDIEPTLATLRPLLATPETIRKFRERVEIGFEGYDHHREELWEIAPVRDFVHRLDEKFPYWLYFLSREGLGLECLARCHLLPYLTEQAQKTEHPKAMGELLSKWWMPAMNAAATEAGWTEDDLMDLTESALKYLYGNPARGRWIDP